MSVNSTGAQELLAATVESTTLHELITQKAFANSSPGLLQPGEEAAQTYQLCKSSRTPFGVRTQMTSRVLCKAE